MTRVAELERAIVARPDDVELRAVHADAVLEHGEPGDRKRGELIQLALAGERGDAQAARRAWGLQRKARARLANAIDRKYVLRMTWRHGSVDSIAIESRMYRTDPEELLTGRTLGALTDLLHEPEVFALRALDTRTAGGATVDALVGLVEHLPIRWLGTTHCTTRAEIDQLHTLPHLDGLGIDNQDFSATLAAIEGQSWLRDLELTSVTGSELHLLTQICPQLERLVLYGVGTPWVELGPIFERTALPALRDLGIMGTGEVTSWMLQQLVDSPLLAQLRSLGFCAAEVYDTDEARDWLQHHRERFAHLRLFTHGVRPDADRGHESGRLAMLLDTLSRSADSIDDQQHHLDHSGGQQVHAACWGRLANALAETSNYAEGLRAVDRGIEIMGEAYGSAAYMYRTRLFALKSLERDAEAIAAGEQALARDPDDAWTSRHLGELLCDAGRYADARAAFDHAIASGKPSDAANIAPWAHLLRGELEFGRRDYPTARADAERVLAITSETDARRRAHMLLGAIAYRQRDLGMARPHFVDALALSGREEHDAITCLCFTLFESGELPLALTTWQIAAQQFDWADIEEQGHVLIAMGRPADALTTLANGLETGGARALALHALGRTDEAIAALDNIAVVPAHSEPACAFRFAAGMLLQGLLARSPRDAAKLLELPTNPLELHAALLRRLRGRDTSACRAESCARRAAIAVLAIAIEVGNREAIETRARAFTAFEETHLADRLDLVWELRAALALSPSPLLAAALATLERDAPTAEIHAALDQAARGAGS